MKKAICTVISLLIVLFLCSCGAEKQENQITGLLDQGYACTSSMCSDSKWAAFFENEDSHLVVTAPLSKAQVNSYDKLDVLADNYEDQQRKFMAGITDMNIIDVSDQEPSQDDLDAYIGRTFGDLESDGFENSGYYQSDNNVVFFYDGDIFTVEITPEAVIAIDDMDDYSVNDLRALKIGSIEFTGFSSNILDNYM